MSIFSIFKKKSKNNFLYKIVEEEYFKKNPLEFDEKYSKHVESDLFKSKSGNNLLEDWRLAFKEVLIQIEKIKNTKEQHSELIKCILEANHIFSIYKTAKNHNNPDIWWDLLKHRKPILENAPDNEFARLSMLLQFFLYSLLSYGALVKICEEVLNDIEMKMEEIKIHQKFFDIYYKNRIEFENFTCSYFDVVDPDNEKYDINIDLEFQKILENDVDYSINTLNEFILEFENDIQKNYLSESIRDKSYKFLEENLNSYKKIYELLE